MTKAYSFTKTDPGSWQSPKYKEAVKKAIEILESNMYKDVLSEADFWQLTGKTKTGNIAYNGLIISHNGCLKINSVQADNNRFRPECVSLDKDGYNGSLVYTYICPEQEIYEVGEVSKSNCTNGYPYAMALKRCMDRVILKISRLAYAGIYSDSEAEEFKNEPKEEEVKAPEDPVDLSAFTVVLPEGAMENPRQALVDYCKNHGYNIMNVAKSHKLNNSSEPGEFLKALAELVANEEGTV